MSGNFVLLAWLIADQGSGVGRAYLQRAQCLFSTGVIWAIPIQPYARKHANGWHASGGNFCDYKDGTSVLASLSHLAHHTGYTTKGWQVQERFQGHIRLVQQTDVHINSSLEIGYGAGKQGVWDLTVPTSIQGVQPG